jgi:hypothetical protein
MKHLTEEQLMLFYYQDVCDAKAIADHLAVCTACKSEFSRLSSVLAEVKPTAVPEPAQDYELRTWQAVRAKLPEGKPSASPFKGMFPSQTWGMAAAAAVIVVIAFLAGRHSIVPIPNTQQVATAPSGQRILLVGVGNHLEKSQMLLIEILNADDRNHLDLSNEQGQARELLETNRLLRISSSRSGDPEVTRVLDELERLLIEVANSPSGMSEGDLQRIQQRIQSQGLLFRVRVIGSKVRRPETAMPGNTAQETL